MAGFRNTRPEPKKPTKIQFKDYVRIQKSGATNMFDIKTVVSLSKHKLTEANCLYIMDHYLQLAMEYGVIIK